MPSKNRVSDFFVAGGTLKPSVPSYVKRPADDELFNLTLAGEYCYVLTPRQMGKSSLMVRAARRLQAEGIHAAIIDLTDVGKQGRTIDEWYLGLLGDLQRELRLTTNPETWWQEHNHLGQPQRFRNFLIDVALAELDGRIAIFIDEIDTTLNLDFTDDFFAVIRALFNRRAQNPELERLTFVLLGVASPSDLIEDSARTPYNIGQEINLHEFSREDASILEQGLTQAYPNQGQTIFERIFYWTNGHPYLTQRLCKAIAQSGNHVWSDNEIDGIVEKMFLSVEARNETNIQFVRKRILTNPQKTQLLKLYQKIYRGRTIPHDKRSADQSQLKLSGLVKVENGRLGVRNQIYRHAFDLRWVRKNIDRGWQFALTVASSAIAIIAVGLLIYSGIIAIRANNAKVRFWENESPQIRANALVTLFNSPPNLFASNYEAPALSMLFELSESEQSAIFAQTEFNEFEDLELLATKLYVKLAEFNINEGNFKFKNQPVLREMASALSQFAKEEITCPNPSTTTPSEQNERAFVLKEEIVCWMKARELAEAGEYEEAREYYNAAIAINGNNSATYYERATVNIQLNEQDLALDDLAQAVASLELENTPRIIKHNEDECFFDSNDTFEEASGPLAPGRTYCGILDDENDFYFIELSTPGVISVTLHNDYWTLGNQFQPNDVLTLYQLDDLPESKGRCCFQQEQTHTVNIQADSAGRYYLLVQTIDIVPATYSLIWSIEETLSVCHPSEAFIDSFEGIPSELEAGQTLNLLANYSGSDLSFSWSTTAGEFDDPSANSVVFTAPESAGSAGTVSITLKANNACGASEDQLSLDIVSPPLTPTSTPSSTPMPTSTATPTVNAVTTTRVTATATVDNATAAAQTATAQAIEVATTQANETVTAVAQATETAAIATARAVGTSMAATATANAILPITDARAELQPGNTTVRFTWEWDGVLGPNMYFVVRFGPVGNVHSRIWTTDFHYELSVGDNTIFPKGQSYDWHIALIRDLPPLGGGTENDSSWEEIGEETARSGPHAPIVLPHVEPTIAPPP